MTLEIYRDLSQNTTSINLNSGRMVQQHVSKGSYFLKYMLKGAEGFTSLQGGANIRFDNYMKKVDTFRNIDISAKQTWSNPQITNPGFAHWRFALDEQNMNMVETLLQASSLSPGRQVDYYVDTIAKNEMRSILSFADGMEDGLWALPDHSEMEKASGILPNSLATFVNEMSDGMYRSYRTANGGDNKVLGIDTVEYPVWKNQVETYQRAGAYDLTGAETHLFDGFDKIMLAMNFGEIPTPGGEKYSDGVYGSKAIATQGEGLTNYQAALRINNDQTRVGPQDAAYPNPLYNGVPVMWVSTLDTAPIYPTVGGDPYAATPTETGYGPWDSIGGGPTNAGPRYHFYDFGCTQAAFHEKRYFKKLKIKEPTNQVETLIQPIICYYNNITDNRRIQGILRPALNVV